MMTIEEINNRLIFALSKFKEKPDYLLWLDGTSLGTYDLPMFSNIPVLHIDCWIINPYNNATVGVECPFIPVWNNERSLYPSITKKFVYYYGDGYEG